MRALHYDRIATVWVTAPLQRLMGAKRHAAISVLMYHSVCPATSDSKIPYYETVTDPDSFASQMDFLRKNDYTVLDLETAAGKLQSGKNIPERAVVITFDDGFEDFYTFAWPILKKHNYTATVFLPTAYIGQHERKRFKDRSCMVWSEVSLLAQNGVRFGGHTVSHRKLATLSQGDLDQELSGCRKEIEENLKQEIRTFASPYAFPQADTAFVGRYREAVKKAGYAVALTTCIGRAQPGDDLLTLKRLPMNRFDDCSLLEAKLNGAYDWLAIVQRAVQAWKTRADGRHFRARLASQNPGTANL